MAQNSGALDCGQANELSFIHIRDRMMACGDGQSSQPSIRVGRWGLPPFGIHQLSRPTPTKVEPNVISAINGNHLLAHLSCSA